MRLTSLCLLICWLLAGPAAAGEIYAPPKGSPLRATLLDAARPAFEAQVRAPVEFVVQTLNVMDGWAFGSVKPQRPGGVPIDWSRTKFAEDVAQGMFETDISFFLLRDDGSGWKLVEYALGPTDVAWDWWRQQNKLPYELFGHTPEDFGVTPSPRPQQGN
jgi:hypothetical protein